MILLREEEDGEVSGSNVALEVCCGGGPSAASVEGSSGGTPCYDITARNRRPAVRVEQAMRYGDFRVRCADSEGLEVAEEVS